MSDFALKVLLLFLLTEGQLLARTSSSSSSSSSSSTPNNYRMTCTCDVPDATGYFKQFCLSKKKETYCQHHNCVKESYTKTSCFPGTSSIIIYNEDENNLEEIIMEKLQIGDQILTYDIESNKIIIDQVIGFLHKELEIEMDFLQIQTEQNYLQITPTHLLFINNSNSIEEIMAKELQIGDTILIKQNEEIKQEIVRNITLTKGNDLYAPLTRTGTLIGRYQFNQILFKVNNIVTSCYTSFKNQNIAHYSFLPYRIITNIISAKYLDYSIENINWYAWILMQISSYMPSQLNYQEQIE